MLDPEGRPIDPPGGGETTPPPDAAAAPTSATDPLGSSDWPAVGYWAAIRGYPMGPNASAVPPATWRPEPPPPTWTRTYELPSARKVVSSGLQLAVAASAPIRRASIYIGLLSLGAFGPTVILLLLGIGRLASIPQTTDTFSADPTLLFWEQPDLIGPLSFIYILASFGLILLSIISIDAQAIAIALLGGTASDRPLHLRESLARARQTFWRLAGSGFLVGMLSGFVSLLVAVPFIRPFDSNLGITFIASIVGTLVVVPFAFASTGIVLGDVGAMEALRRSVGLFKARPRIALVVALFTLVTAAIQTFALGAGLDLASRVAEFLDLGLDQGGIGLILSTLLVLAFIVAFGSLTFTIAAIVAAPQVAGFLGLTFYSGGLDRARSDTAIVAGSTVDAPLVLPVAEKPKRARWVTRKMLACMAGLAVVAGLGLPTIYGFVPRAASPVLAVLRDRAAVHEEYISPSFESVPVVVEDPAGDQGVGGGSASDILAMDMAGLYFLPDWLLEDLFPCGSAGVACGVDTNPERYDIGAVLFVQRMAGAPPQVPDGGHSEWGPLLTLDGFSEANAVADPRFAGATHRFSTELDGTRLRIREYYHERSDWIENRTAARSAWRGELLVTIVPWEALPGQLMRWDAYAWVRDPAAPGEDNVRPADGAMAEIPYDWPWFEIYGLNFFEVPSFEP